MKDQAVKLRKLVAADANDMPHEGKIIAKFPVKARRPRIIAVTSGKGGVGKTTIAVNLALLIAETSARVLIVDADLGLANVDVMLGIDAGRHIGHLLLPNCTAEEVALDGPMGISVISGGSGLRELADASSEERMTLLEKLRAYYNEFDFVLIDTSPGISADVLDFLGEADRILLVTTPEPTSLRDTYAALKAITCTMPLREVIPVVNSATKPQAKQVMHALNHVATKFLNTKCDCWHQVESDSLVGRAIHSRKPFVRTYPKSPAAICLRRLAGSIVSSPVRDEHKSKKREETYALA